MPDKPKHLTPDFAKNLPWIMLTAGAIALVASILLAVEVYNRLKNPAYVPVCNLNPILSCTDVADSAQAHAFGLPNYFLGIAGYAAITTIGAVLLAGAKLRRRFWQLVQVGMTFAIAFIIWLQFQSIYRIGALCLFCMITWAATIPGFWYVSLFNLQSGNLPLPTKLKKTSSFIQRHHLDILIVWFLIVIALILKRFWYYWKTV